jgi:hypothetical protein
VGLNRSPVRKFDVCGHCSQFCFRGRAGLVGWFVVRGVGSSNLELTEGNGGTLRITSQ